MMNLICAHVIVFESDRMGLIWRIFNMPKTIYRCEFKAFKRNVMTHNKHLAMEVSLFILTDVLDSCQFVLFNFF